MGGERDEGRGGLIVHTMIRLGVRERERERGGGGENVEWCFTRRLPGRSHRGEKGG